MQAPENESEKTPWGSFWSLTVIQSMNALNEKGVQFLLIGLGIWLAMEGGACLRKGNRVFGWVILAAAVALVLSPMTLSRLVFSACGLVVLLIGISMLLSRIRDQRFLDQGDDNIIDAL